MFRHSGSLGKYFVSILAEIFCKYFGWIWISYFSCPCRWAWPYLGWGWACLPLVPMGPIKKIYGGWAGLVLFFFYYYYFFYCISFPALAKLGRYHRRAGASKMRMNKTHLKEGNQNVTTLSYVEIYPYMNLTRQNCGFKYLNHLLSGRS